ncbi:hypothetical protein [Hymenobacter jeollabukensis]|uniref:Iron-containing redox enzyme family protein n=1 Tax=Hymenobacter jeollabukensis TaxID=2025313 RepID=A0A5R8WJB1_9BACT|nr:hypothetical protein [Hymenobacter jeollabukensis]TLM88859.1 hypothetical protein FDY95_22010 [Hymenobacter jeollabukensis]
MKTQPDALPIEQFIHELSEIRANALNDIRAGKFGLPVFLQNENSTEAQRRPEIIFLLQLGVYPEYRETHFLSRQIQRLDDVDFIYRIGEQIFDEAKHTKVLVDQLRVWGAEPFVFWEQPIIEWSGAFDYMDRQVHPAEYFVGSNFIGEGLFLGSIMAPMSKYDPETFQVYVEHIMPDEPRHINIGKDIIAKYCTTYELQERVRRVATIVAKQYCLGFEAAMNYANCAKNGNDPSDFRDQTQKQRASHFVI